MLQPRLPSRDPEWEAMKGSRRNQTLAEAVQEVAFLQKQWRLIAGKDMASSPVDLYRILHVLIEKRIPFVLTGAHGISGWTGRPRNTLDVDILAKPGRNHARAVKAAQELYPELEVRRFTGLTAFFVPGQKESVIDVVCPYRADQEETLAHPAWADDQELGLRYRVPTLEAALANKYGAMLALTRDMPKRLQDAVDFSWMVQHSSDPGRTPIDLERLAFLGEKVWPGGGGQEILSLVEQVKAGEAIHVVARAK
ncbi:MAG TPA: hypothetical protein VMS17_33205 [Gemmataceae bacterium]|nr:hypothetical protein [Gemmataceae bacterium]